LVLNGKAAATDKKELPVRLFQRSGVTASSRPAEELLRYHIYILSCILQAERTQRSMSANISLLKESIVYLTLTMFKGTLIVLNMTSFII